MYIYKYVYVYDMCNIGGSTPTYSALLAGKLSLKEIQNVQMSFEVVTFSEVIGF